MRNNCVYINELPASSNCISISTKHVGKVGTGFRRKVARELHQVLAPLAIEKPPLETVRDAKTMWVRPQYQTEIEYRAITGDGLSRHASTRTRHEAKDVPATYSPRPRSWLASVPIRLRFQKAHGRA